MTNYAKLFAAIIICQFAGLIGSVFTFDSIPTWYALLNKPFFSPPNWVFGPAWITLYTLMGLSLYLVLEKQKGKKLASPAVVIFTVQLALNAIWSIIFFGMKAPMLAFFEIVLLWLAIAATILKFRTIDVRAAYLLIPYILWVSFASLLNLFVWLLNP